MVDLTEKKKKKKKRVLKKSKRKVSQVKTVPTKDVSDWRQECIEQFGLRPLPASWINDKLSKLTKSDNETWKSYYHYRKFHELAVSDWDDESCDENTSTLSDNGSRMSDRISTSCSSSSSANFSGISRESQGSKLSHLTGTKSNKPSIKNLDRYLLQECRRILKDITKEIGIPSWLKHWRVYVDSVWDQKSEDLISADFSAIIFSPFAIPHAMELEHCIRNRSSHSSHDFKADWKFKLVRFDGLLNGDEVQQHLARLFPKRRCGKDEVRDENNDEKEEEEEDEDEEEEEEEEEDDDEEDDNGKSAFVIPQQQKLYDSEKKMEYLCSNYDVGPHQSTKKGTLAPPSFLGRLEDIDVSNFNPTTIRRIRQWILASPQKSLRVVSDFELLQLLFASCGSPDFNTIEGSIGYEWNPRLSNFAGRTYRDLDEEEANAAPTNWLEYQARLVSNSLRPGDMYYKPYNVFEAKADLTQALFKHKLNQQELEKYLKGARAGPEIWKMPWILLDRAGEQLHQANSCVDNPGRNVSLLWDKFLRDNF